MASELLFLASRQNQSHGEENLVTALLPVHPADQDDSLGAGPTTQLDELIVVNKKLLRTSRADDRLLAVAPGLAPLKHIAVGVAFPLAQMTNDCVNSRAERIVRLHPGSESIMMRLLTASAFAGVGNVGAHGE